MANNTVRAWTTGSGGHHRLPAKRWPRTRRRYRVEDRRLREILSRHTLQSHADLLELLPPELPDDFTTAEIAEFAGIPRWLAQKMAYVLRKSGAAEECGKQGNAIVYRIADKTDNLTRRSA